MEKPINLWRRLWNTQSQNQRAELVSGLLKMFDENKEVFCKNIEPTEEQNAIHKNLRYLLTLWKRNHMTRHKFIINDADKTEDANFLHLQFVNLIERQQNEYFSYLSQHMLKDVFKLFDERKFK
eukprot:GHVL01011620.1.p1 GENE.GHVL01011620.1~~GHVL01011620.1.p1  ORF type:complete len:124 (-),score=13.93 GHVL01011620.1:24-395(-)